MSKLGGLFGSLLLSLGGERELAFDLFREYEDSDLSRATFAGGCFWGLEKVFEELDGVEEGISGYTGGETENPGYEEVCTGETGHYEAVRIYFDSDLVGYSDLLEVFWDYIAPGYLGPDSVISSQYTTAVFYHNDRQKELADKTKKELVCSGEDVGTEIRRVERFYPAEKYHQDYYTNDDFNDSSCFSGGGA